MCFVIDVKSGVMPGLKNTNNIFDIYICDRAEQKRQDGCVLTNPPNSTHLLLHMLMDFQQQLQKIFFEVLLLKVRL